MPTDQTTQLTPADPERSALTDVVTNATNLALAQTDYLDVSRPKPRISILALKYDLSPSYLMRMSIKQDWDGLRNKAETNAALQVTPEVRKAVVCKIDGVILRSAEGIASKVLDVYSRLIDEVAEIKTEGSEEAAIDDAELTLAAAPKGKKGKKEPKGPKRPSLSSKIAMLNEATSGINEFMKSFRDLGLTLIPDNQPDKSGGQLKTAIPIGGTTPAIPPPPIDPVETPVAQVEASPNVDLPPPPPA